MSPVSSPEAVGMLGPEALRETVAAATEQAMAGMRAWQRSTEARIDRLELAIGELIAHARTAAAAPAVAATAASAAPGPAPATQNPFVSQAPAVVQSAPATAAPVEAPAPRARYQSIAPGPDYPVIVATTPPVRVSWADASGSGAAYDPLDPDMILLSGGRRRRRITFVALFLLIVGVVGLVALAIASQAAHGL